MTYLEDYLWRALISATRYIPKSSVDASCHHYICSEKQCIRCSNARFIYSALKAGYEAKEQEAIIAELPK